MSVKALANVGGVQIEVDLLDKVISIDGVRVSKQFLDALNEQSSDGVTYRLMRTKDGVLTFHRDPAAAFWERLAAVPATPMQDIQDAFQRGVETGALAERTTIQLALEKQLMEIAFQQMLHIWSAQSATAFTSAFAKSTWAVVKLLENFRQWLAKRT